MKCQYIDCQDLATVRLGRKEQIYLCDQHSRLDEFKKLTVRVELPKPLDRSLVGRCFSNNFRVYLIESVDTPKCCTAIEIKFDEFSASVKRVNFSSYALGICREITREKFDFIGKKAIIKAESLMARLPDVSIVN